VTSETKKSLSHVTFSLQLLLSIKQTDIVKEVMKQNEFMMHYEPCHEQFIRYCKAKSYGIIADYKDLVNETILRAFEGFDRLKNKHAFCGFLYSTASNIIKNELRSKRNKEIKELNEINLTALEQNHAEQKFEIEVLYTALSRLPESQKEAIILFEINGYSLKEVADIQNVGLSAVKLRLKRGREKLADILTVPALKEENADSRSKILITLFF